MNSDNGYEKRRRVLAIIGLVLMGVFIIGACICMVLGNKELMMASLFAVVFVPIMIYCFIMVYDMVHKDDDKPFEEPDGDAEAAEKEVSDDAGNSEAEGK